MKIGVGHARPNRIHTNLKRRAFAGKCFGDRLQPPFACAIKNIVAILGAILATIGITSEILWLKISGILGIISIPISFVWKTKWTN